MILHERLCLRNYMAIASSLPCSPRGGAAAAPASRPRPAVAGAARDTKKVDAGDGGDDHREGRVRRARRRRTPHQHGVGSRLRRPASRDVGVDPRRQRRPPERVRLHQGRTRQQVPLRHADRAREAGSEGLPLRPARRRRPRRPAARGQSTATTRCTTCTACRKRTASSTRASRWPG